ncbi:hypothetical protein L0222_19205 [bacterium]|nr:hypothetical protein [bacterium]MCI0602830.1 hypothetical protein [bacterium]
MAMTMQLVIDNWPPCDSAGHLYYFRYFYRPEEPPGTPVYIYDSPLFEMMNRFTPPAISFDIPDNGVYNWRIGAQMYSSNGTFAGSHVVFVPAVKITIATPGEGENISGCSVRISGEVNNRWQDQITINLEGNTFPIPVAFDKTFNTTVPVSFGIHSLVASYYGGVSPTRLFSSSCRMLQFVGPTAIAETRVLLHNYGPQPYTSSYQSRDGQIEVRFKTTKDSAGSAPLPNQTVYMRVQDPQDASPYVTNPASDDNKGGDKGDPSVGRAPIPALLSGSGLTQVPDSNPPAWTATSDSNGEVKVFLEVPGSAGNSASGSNKIAAAGDNYIIEASYYSDFSQIVKSSLLTAWNRVYVDHLKMWKTGEFLIQPSAAGSSELFVANISTFKKGEIVLISSAFVPAGEERSIKSVDMKNKKLILNPPALSNSYQSTVSTSCDPANGTFSAYCAKHPHSFVAKVISGTYDVLPADTRYSRAYDDAFVELKFGSGNYLPSWPIVPEPGGVAFLQNRIQWYWTAPAADPRNHMALASIASNADQGWFGINYAYAGFPIAVVFRQEIADYYFSGNFQNAIDDLAAHEMAHSWYFIDHEFQYHAWEGLPGDPWCLMDYASEPTLGVHKLHVLSTDSDLMCVRNSQDLNNRDPLTCPE